MSRKETPVVIIGAGGHAKVLLDALFLMKRNVVALVEKNGIAATKIWGVPVIEEKEFFYRYNPCSVVLVNGLGSTKQLHSRRKVYERFCGLGYSFTSVIHPSAIISPHCELASDVQVMAGAVIQAGCKVGANTIVNTRVSIDHDCQIGPNVHIAPGSVVSGGVFIGGNTHVGTGAVIIQGIDIGEQVLIAAGAVVIANIPDQYSAKGLPARNYRVEDEFN